MPKVEKESASAIRGLVDYTLKHLRVLKSLNLTTDSWSKLIVHMIEAKLDDHIARVGATWRHNGRDNGKFNRISGKKVPNIGTDRSKNQGQECHETKRTGQAKVEDSGQGNYAS